MGPAAKAATATIPIVFVTASDPVAAGLVASLNRPGGNITGVTGLGMELGPKRLELLHELVPTVTILALLVNPTSPIAETLTKDLQAAARTLGLQFHVLHASTERDFDAVFASLVELRAGALVIAADVFFTSRSQQLAALTVRHAVPTIYQFREFAVAGRALPAGAGRRTEFAMYVNPRRQCASASLIRGRKQCRRKGGLKSSALEGPGRGSQGGDRILDELEANDRPQHDDRVAEVLDRDRPGGKREHQSDPRDLVVKPGQPRG